MHERITDFTKAFLIFMKINLSPKTNQFRDW